MQALTRQQLAILVLLTLVWGLNWPVMKLGVTDFPPLTFRALSIWLGLPVLGAGAGGDEGAVPRAAPPLARAGSG